MLLSFYLLTGRFWTVAMAWRDGRLARLRPKLDSCTTTTSKSRCFSTMHQLLIIIIVLIRLYKRGKWKSWLQFQLCSLGPNIYFSMLINPVCSSKKSISSFSVLSRTKKVDHFSPVLTFVHRLNLGQVCVPSSESNLNLAVSVFMLYIWNISFVHCAWLLYLISLTLCYKWF